MDPSDDLIVRLAQIADDLAPLGTHPLLGDQLSSVCDTARTILGAAAVSLARVSDTGGGHLEYVAAHGAGASGIVGALLPAGQGLAGFVVATGQSLAIDRVQDDPRFAREVAESTGYVPTSMLVVPVLTANGSILGVLSVLDRATDRAPSTADALEVAGAFARQAATVLVHLDLCDRIAPILLGSLSSAVESGDADLAAALRHIATTLPEPDRELAEVAALLADLRNRPSHVRAAALRVLEELVSVAASGRSGE